MSSNRDRMKKAIENRPLAKRDAAAKKPVAAAAMSPPKPPDPPAPKKENHRSAKARDARAKARGRLPLGYGIEGHWDGAFWVGRGWVQYDTGPLAPMIAWEFVHKADGQFRLMEEIDIAFWQWVVENPEDAKALKWPEKTTKPEPYPKEGT